MIRVVIAVVVATALLAASLPAVDSARADRTAAQLDGELAALSDSAASLVDRDDATATGLPGARRVVSLTIPARSWTAAGVDSVTVGCRDECRRPTVSYTLDNGRTRRVHLDLPLVVADGPLVFRASGTHRLTLTLERGDVERQPGSSGTVVVVRRG